MFGVFACTAIAAALVFIAGGKALAFIGTGEVVATEPALGAAAVRTAGFAVTIWDAFAV